MRDRDNELQSSVGLSDMFVWLRSHKITLLAPTFVCLVLGVIYILISPPRYKVDTLLAPKTVTSSSQAVLNQLDSQLGGIGLGGVLNQGAADRSDTGVSLAILESRQFLGDFIVRHNLMPILFESRWDKDEEDWAEGVDSPPTVNDGYRVFNENVLLVELDEVYGLVTVSLEWTDANVANDWLVLLIRDLNDDIRKRERDEATRSLEYLRKELARTDIMELQQALHQLSRIELRRLTMVNVHEEFAFKTIDPPFVPDIDDPIWPRPALVILSSLFFGLIFGVGTAVLLTGWRLSARSS
jgi:uncharacterized protein involved in exopolysaccharide biosynthesis